MNQYFYYAVTFGLAFFLTLIYVLLWRRNFDTHLTVVFIIVPIANLAYLLMYAKHDPETAEAMLKITYIGGCFLPWLTTMCVLRICHIEPKRILRMISFLFSTLIYCSVLTIGHRPLFYSGLELEQISQVWVQEKVYGPFHTILYILILFYLAADVVIIAYSYYKELQVSRRILFLLFIPIPVSIIGYVINHYTMSMGYEIVPLTYVFAEFIYLLIARRMAFYNVSEMVIESEVRSGDMGFIIIDKKFRYLGSNETAKRIMPELSKIAVDKCVLGYDSVKHTVIDWLDTFKASPRLAQHLIYIKNENTADEKIYSVNVGLLTEGTKQVGYQIFLRDDTKNQKYIKLLDSYNTDLQADVDAKTERIIAMHDRLILGMATMVESRDNSTGGHIRRTSEGVRILISEMKKDKSLGLSEEFCKDLIKAAPMHDLGKIAVDDAILRKPGRFTPEEFEIMKTHAAEGAKIVHSILQDTDDEKFRRIAENVAHYHHERMDGSGYPDGLKGEEIPLEARIMAIADVYDALVSKRVYKDSFSFEKADSIIMDSMGSQFDPRLKPYYETARPRLEAYYAANA